MAEESAIEEKKKEPEKPKNTFYAFISDIFKLFFQVCILILIGVYILYAAKVDRSGIISTDKDCEPYEYTKREFGQNGSDTHIFIDIVKLLVDKKNIVEGTRINFTDTTKPEPTEEDPAPKSIYENNINNFTEGYLGIGYAKNWMHAEDSTFYSNYIASIQEDVFVFFAKYMGVVYKMTSSIFSESMMTFLIGPLTAMFILPFLSFVTVIYGLILTITRCSYFLYERKDYTYEEPQSDGTPETRPYKKWEWPEKEGWGLYWLYFKYLVILFITLMFSFMGGFSLTGLLVVIPMLKYLIMPFFMSAKIGGKDYKPSDPDDDTPYGYFTAFLNTFKYKRQVIMIFMIINIVLSAYTYFDVQGLISAIFACVFLWMFFKDVYKQYVPEDIPFVEKIPLNIFNSNESVNYKCTAYTNLKELIQPTDKTKDASNEKNEDDKNTNSLWNPMNWFNLKTWI